MQTKRLEPPQDDVAAALCTATFFPQESDVVCISSKVVAIHEGRCEQLTKEVKQKRIVAEAEAVIKRPYWSSPLTMIHHYLVSGAGMDQSNGNGYTVLLPKDPFASAEWWQQWLRAEYGLHDVGVIITDSRSLPLRYGATGVAIGWWGIEPLQSHIGTNDLFGRPLQYERSNLVDGIAAAATVVMGETNESTPVVIVRNVPRLTYTERNTKNELFCPPEDDTFRVLYEDKLRK